jgi:hypothetical protein
MFAANYLARFTSKPVKKTLESSKTNSTIFQETIQLCFMFGKKTTNENFSYCDSDLANEIHV